jgi:predicted Co/Zn/Cd cation transporter (cation efflux family)
MTPEERFERIERILEETAEMHRHFAEESKHNLAESQKRLTRIEEILLVTSEMQRRHEEKWDKHFAQLGQSQQALFEALRKLAEALTNVFGQRRRSNGDQGEEQHT